MLNGPAVSIPCPGQANYVCFRLSPDVAIAIGTRVKRHGEDLIGDPTELKVVSHPHGHEMGTCDYTLGDAMTGEGSRFVRGESRPRGQSFSLFWGR
jgi:glucose-6-phosphate 1-dehydrogenase